MTQKVKDLYDDVDGRKKAEISVMSAPSNEFTEFYRRFKQIKDYYKTKPHIEPVVPMSTEYENFVNNYDSEVNMVEFNDEESYGKFLDLNEQFRHYINLKSIVGTNQSKIDYLSYLNSFDQFHEIPKSKKFSADYQQYLQSLLDYLIGYIGRIKPLLPMNDVSL